MCGIAGYIGQERNGELLFDMLKRLEYRGYDSAGIAYLSEKKISLVKNKGRVKELEKKVNPQKISFSCGIAHTRWATHGIPNKKNAHPHGSCQGKFAVIHNGIIEDYLPLRKELK